MGGELLIGIALGFIVLGPKRMQTMLGQLGRAKTELEKARRGIGAQLNAEADTSQPAQREE